MGQEVTLAPIKACIGSQGTTFLTSSVWLAHLKDGESITAPEEIAGNIPGTPEFTLAVLELQRQHGDMLRLIEEHTPYQCEELCADGECLSCDMSEVTNGWEASRV